MSEEYIPTKENMFFLCYLVESLCRETLNNKHTVVSKMSRDYVLNILENEECYHVLSREQLVGEQKEELGLTKGRFNPVGLANYKVPSISAMARLYSNLVFMFDGNHIDNFFKVMLSPICDFIDDYNSSLHYENREYIKDCIKVGHIIRIGVDEIPD